MPLPAGVVTGGLFEIAARAGVFQRLRADTELRGMLLGGMHDGKASATPTGGAVPMPYLVFTESTELPDDRLTGTGRVVFLVLEIMSTYQGAREALRIADRVATLLDHQQRALNTGVKWVCNMCRIDHTQSMVNEDNIRTTVVRVQLSGQPRF